MRLASTPTATQRLFRHVRRSTRSFLELVFPQRCIACEDIASTGRRWCGVCEARLARLENAPCCDVCAMPLTEFLAPCPYCSGTGLRPFDRIARLGTFETPLRDFIHRIKYHNDWPLGDVLAARLWQQDAVRDILRERDVVIVPVPLHWRRQWRRGFNQAAVIAQHLARKSRRKLRHAVVRIRPTPTQTSMHKRERRLENLANAFGVLKPQHVRGKHVVLVDDVITTAATLQTLARELRRYEPKSISVIVVAIADPKGRAFETI